MAAPLALMAGTNPAWAVGGETRASIASASATPAVAAMRARDQAGVADGFMDQRVSGGGGTLKK